VTASGFTARFTVADSGFPTKTRFCKVQAGTEGLESKLEDEALLFLCRMAVAYVIVESLLPHLFHVLRYSV